MRPCAYLLNDNLALRGPWFDSVDWLERAWLPHARRLGLRYIAHVVQADTHTDIVRALVSGIRAGQAGAADFQRTLAEAEDWLRSCLPPA